MKDFPRTIEKRYFTCKDCGYSAQVHGEMCYDYAAITLWGRSYLKNARLL